VSYYVYGNPDGLGAIPGGTNYPGLSAIPGGRNYPGLSAIPGGTNYPGLSFGFGAVDFSASVVWSDWLAGSKGDNAAGKRAADTIRAALGQLGYGPFKIGVMWGSPEDKAGYTKFTQQTGMPPTSGMPTWWPNQASLQKLEELVKAGGTPGGGPVQEFHTTPAGIVSGPAPGAKALTAGLSTGTKIALAAAAAAVLAGVVLLGKKKGPQPTSARPPSRPSTAMTTMR
jgi:hypothetical protein